MPHTSQTQQTTPATIINRNLEKMQSLPESQRRIFAILSMIGATLTIGMLFLFLSSPLQNIAVPLSEHSAPNAQNAAIFQGISNETPPQNTQNANDIPHISPINGFLDSFNAVKNLFLPEHARANEQATASLWSVPLSELPRALFVAVKNFIQSIAAVAQPFINTIIMRVRAYAPDTVDAAIAFVYQIKELILHIFQLIIYFFTLSFRQIAHVISAILDRLISRVGVSVY